MADSRVTKQQKNPLEYNEIDLEKIQRKENQLKAVEKEKRPKIARHQNQQLIQSYKSGTHPFKQEQQININDQSQIDSGSAAQEESKQGSQQFMRDMYPRILELSCMFVETVELNFLNNSITDAKVQGAI